MLKKIAKWTLPILVVVLILRAMHVIPPLGQTAHPAAPAAFNPPLPSGDPGLKQYQLGDQTVAIYSGTIPDFYFQIAIEFADRLGRTKERSLLTVADGKAQATVVHHSANQKPEYPKVYVRLTTKADLGYGTPSYQIRTYACQGEGFDFSTLSFDTVVVKDRYGDPTKVLRVSLTRDQSAASCEYASLATVLQPLSQLSE